MARRPGRVDVLGAHACPDERGGATGRRPVARPLHLPLRHGLRGARGRRRPRPDPPRPAGNADPLHGTRRPRSRASSRSWGSASPRGATAWSGESPRPCGAGRSRWIPTAASATASSARAPSAGQGGRRGPRRPRVCSAARSPCGRISPTRTTTSGPPSCSRGAMPTRRRRCAATWIARPGPPPAPSAWGWCTCCRVATRRPCRCCGPRSS